MTLHLRTFVLSIATIASSVLVEAQQPNFKPVTEAMLLNLPGDQAQFRRPEAGEEGNVAQRSDGLHGVPLLSD